MTQHLTPADYLKKILTARVYDVAVESALEPAKNLSRRLHNKVLLKREDQQPVFSFKLRGAYNKMAHLTPEQLQRGVICASAGNHAQGVALGARRLGTTAVIVMPVTTPQVKVDAVRALGGRAWQALHRLVYVIAPLALLHFFWMKSGKNDFAEVAVYALVIATLLLERLVRYFKPKSRASA